MFRLRILLSILPFSSVFSAFSGPYAVRPNDPYFSSQLLYDNNLDPRIRAQWNLENKSADAERLGVDLNVRAAWPLTRGSGVVIAIVDNGVDLDHHDLRSQEEPSLHYNFALQTTNGAPLRDGDNHGTAVAGMAIATGYNGIGITGVAPEAHFASWYIYNTNGAGTGFVGPDQLAAMFQYESNRVAIQNHSWVINNTLKTVGPSDQERAAISNAVTFGREGKGVIIVRAAGNDRVDIRNVNDDAYSSDPRVITVAAVGASGAVANYSNPGAAILVSAPSGGNDSTLPELISTDRSGSEFGFNQGIIFPGTDLSDYVFTGTFTGTSAAAPEISGLAALILSVNPQLTYRDVQQILINSSKQWDLSDADLGRNGAGFLVSHNTGFGVPDAAWAVRLAGYWISRPPLTNVITTSSETNTIANGGLRLLVTAPAGTSLPTNLVSIPTMPGEGVHPDVDTFSLPFVDVGLATNDIAIDLHGRIALIQRGNVPYIDKIQRAARAGAAFAIIYNNVDQTKLVLMQLTDPALIPAAFISQRDGEALRDFIKTNSTTAGQLHLDKTVYAFDIKDTLQCEHVSVTLQIDQPVRGDLRITLTSPAGTRSVLQTINLDTNRFSLTGWTYSTTHHFYESSAGSWRVEISDEGRKSAGLVNQVDLNIEGVPILDTDHDGLDDNWERATFGSLDQGAADDPDNDGYRNAREQLLGTNPLVDETPLELNLSPWNDRIVRLSWLGSTGHTYDIMTTADLSKPMAFLRNVSGAFPETEIFLPSAAPTTRFFQIIRH